MRQLHVCPQGHRWDPLDDRRPSVDKRWNRCPICGQSVDAYSMHESNAVLAPAVAQTVTPVPPVGVSTPPIIAGYEILSEIGRGGMGVIYKARHLATERIVALKMISAGTQASESDLARFRTETEAVSRLHHPNIVQIYDVGEQNSLPFFALEYMDGGTLESGLNGTQMPARYAAELVEMLAKAIQTAHEQGIIHRDLKPANVLLTSAKSASADTVVHLLGTPKISDFGLAKRIEDDQRQTQSGAILGTPSYMAPEQAEGRAKDVGPAADIYALGAILYESLTGKPPFKGATILETLEQVRSLDPIPPSRLRSDVPRQLETICLKALAKNPAQRYGSAQALADDLRRFLGGKKVVARPTSVVTKAGKWMKKRKALVATVAGVLIAAVGIGIGLWLMNQGNGSIAGNSPSPNGVDPNETIVEYYRAIVVRRGLPEGLGGMDEHLARRMPSSFRFTKRNGRVERVEAVDHRGLPTSDHSFDRVFFMRISQVRTVTKEEKETEVRWDYQYDDKGILTRETAFDETGTVVWTTLWSFPTAKTASCRFLDDQNNDRKTVPSGASRVEFDFDDAGFVVREIYKSSRQPRPDDFGVFGRRLQHDERGLPLTTTCLGSNGQDEKMCNQGYVSLRRAFDAHGLELETAWFDFDGKPVGYGGAATVSGGLPRSTRVGFKRDEDGRLTELAVAPADLAPLYVFNKPKDDDRRPMAQVLVYDSLGRLESISYRDANGKPTSPPTSHPALRNEYDGRGNLVRTIAAPYTGDRSKPKNNPEEMVPKIVERTTFFGYDERGRQIETRGERYQSTFGGDDRAPNWYREALTLDDTGRIVQADYFDKEGNPAFENKLSPRVRLTYTPRGRVHWVEYLDLDGNPFEIAGVASIQVEYDQAGSVIAQTNYDSDGIWTIGGRRPLGGGPLHSRVRTIRAAKTIYRYDDRGNLTELSHLDSEGKPFNVPAAPALGNTPHATVRSRYDDFGNQIESEYRDASGNLVAMNGVARSTWKYDEFGNITSHAKFDGNNHPILDRDGIAAVTVTYDARCRIISQKFVDAADKPIEFRRSYTKLVSSAAFRGTVTRPVVLETGYARIDLKYDGEKLVSSTYFNQANEAVATRTVVTTAPRPAQDKTRLQPAHLRQLASATGGLQPGDILVNYDDKPVSCARVFLRGKDSEDADGTTRDLEILRDGKPLTLKIPSGPVPILRPETGALAPRTGAMRYVNPNDPVQRLPFQQIDNTWFSLQTIVVENEKK